MGLLLVEPYADGHEVARRPLTRRRLLAAGGAGIASAVFPALARAAAADAPVTPAPPFRSRPDLVPPELEVTTPATGTATGYVFAACQKGAGQLGPMIVDDAGDLVWFRPVTGRTAANFRVQRYRERPVLVWWEGTVLSGHGKGEFVVVDSSYREIARVRAGNGLEGDLHEFALTPQGTALLTAYVNVPADLSSVGGPVDGTLLDSVVQEVDVATGRVLLDWRAGDHLPLDESYAPVSNGVLDHAHLNSVSVFDDRSLLVSARHTWTLYKVDRSTGAIQWRLGGKKSDFAVEQAAAFSWQHHARRRSDGSITVFDNANGPAQEEPRSRGLRLHVDESKRTVALAAEYPQPDGLSASAMGSVEPVAGGGAFIGWGILPSLSEFGPDGSLRFHANLPPGSPSYRAQRSPWVGRPATKPALAVAAVDGARTAFVSWNGATEVAHWRLRTGATARTLAPSKVVRRTGFETAVRLPPHAAWIAVDALDRRGRELGRSRAVQAHRTP